MKVEAAKQLAPSVIMTLPQSELMANLKAVTEEGIMLPTRVHSCLVNIAAAEHLMAADHSDEGIRRLVSCSKPWVVDPQALSIDDKDTWKLGNVAGLDQAARNEWFIDTYMTGFIVKHIGAGEPRANSIKAGCAFLVDVWNKDTFNAEVDDDTASLMEKCLRSCRVLTAIITYDVALLDPDMWDDIDWLGKLRNSSSLDIDSVVAVAIQDSGWFGSRFSKWLEYRAVVERLGDQLTSDLQMWDALDKFDIKTASETTDVVQRLCVCVQAGLAAGYAQQSHTSGLGEAEEHRAERPRVAECL